MLRSRLAAVMIVSAGLVVSLSAGQAPPAQGPPDSLAGPIVAAAKTATTSDAPARLIYANRAITELRATILARPPSVRTREAGERLTRLLDRVPTDRVNTKRYGDAIVISLGAEPVLVIFQADVDALTSENLDSKAAAAAADLQRALDEAVELRAPRQLTRAIAISFAATVAYLLLLWLLMRADRRIAAHLGGSAERMLRRLPVGDLIVRTANARAIVRRLVAFGAMVLGLLLTYAWLAFVLKRFPYTRPWGESLRYYLVAMLAAGGRAFIDNLPNLGTILAIVIITRLLVRLSGLAFNAVERGGLTLPGIYPETAQPTRRIVSAMLWVFALTVAYNYIPGSSSDAFKGVSVFVGLVISLGSTGIMNHIMSGLMITYSRALRCNDFVRIGEVEGTVTQLGALSTKIRTPRNEEITIPNAVVVSSATTNYSRHAETDGLMMPTSVTIGYDVPWRQVEALLLLAASRTPGLKPEPKPVVLQSALDDFYVRYTLLVCLAQPNRRYPTLGALHASIQDAFNEYGVQIMSPNYEADPGAPKVVPPSRWYSAPAASAAAAGHGAVPVGAAEPRARSSS